MKTQKGISDAEQEILDGYRRLPIYRRRVMKMALLRLSIAKSLGESLERYREKIRSRG
ncbi:MAG: hypothetical protein AAF125_08415 [Chloroflexota bacterium]